MDLIHNWLAKEPDWDSQCELYDFIAFVTKMNRKKERTKSPYLKAFQIKFRYGGS